MQRQQIGIRNLGLILLLLLNSVSATSFVLNPNGKLNASDPMIAAGTIQATLLKNATGIFYCAPFLSLKTICFKTLAIPVSKLKPVGDYLSYTYYINSGNLGTTATIKGALSFTLYWRVVWPKAVSVE